jgi:hypothetical protein
MTYLELQLGVAKVDITPLESIPLAGFSHRSGSSLGVLRPIYARFFLIKKSGQLYLLITADLIWWGNIVLKPIQELLKKYGIQSDHILLHATHNHSGPQTSDEFTPSLGCPDHFYLTTLIEKVDEGFKQALENLEPVSLERGDGVWMAGVNRRKMKKGQVVMEPNLKGANDPAVTVIQFKRKDGTTKGLLVHATCHPTTTDENFISSEFPGYAMDTLENCLLEEGVVAGFLQGFCANIRPFLVKEEQFYRGTNADVERIGQELVDVVLEIMKSKMEPINIGDVYLVTKNIKLPFSYVPGHDELVEKAKERGVIGEWSKLLIKKIMIPVEANLEINFFSLSEKLAFLTANAEMVVEYGFYVRNLIGKQVLPIGYTNGIIGYVPTAVQLDEGGYEPIDSTKYFGMPSHFTKEIELLIKSAFQDLKIDRKRV